MVAFLIKARYLSLGTQILLLKAGTRAAHASRIVLLTVPLPPADIADEIPRLFCLDEVCIQAVTLDKAGTPKEKKNR